MTIEKRIFDLWLWFMAGLGLLTSCSATVPLPMTPTIGATRPATQEATVQPLKFSPSTSTPTASPTTCTVATGMPSGYLNLRAGAGIQHSVIRVLREGELLRVLQAGAWLEVIDSEGHHGFINSNFCNQE